MREQRKLTAEQAREFRLSMEPSKAIARRVGVNAGVIRKLRAGESYGVLLPDERAAQQRRMFREAHPDHFYLEDYLLTVGRLQVGGLHDMDRQEAMDAAHECRHGRLSHDPTPACGCWIGELAPVIPLHADERLEAVA